MTQTHTPTPWKAEKNGATAHTFNIFGSFNEAGDGIRLAEVMSGPAEMTEPYCGVPQYKGTQGEANAAFIIKACNNHDRAVLLLKRTLNAAKSGRREIDTYAIEQFLASLGGK